jgi:excisionase family DNA binding protein
MGVGRAFADDLILEREVMTADEVADFLGVDRKTVYEAACRAEVPHRRMGKRLLFSRSALLDWLRCKGSSEGE